MMYQLICDSCTDLPASMLQDSHVCKVPLTIQVGEDTFIDDESFQQARLLEKGLARCAQNSLSLPPCLYGEVS